jgi:hypothetical protein
MLDRLRKSSYQLFGMDLSPPVLKSGHGPTVEERQQSLGIIPNSTNPIDHLPLFLFPDNDRSHRQHVFRSQVVAAVSTLLACYANYPTHIATTRQLLSLFLVLLHSMMQYLLSHFQDLLCWRIGSLQNYVHHQGHWVPSTI